MSQSYFQTLLQESHTNSNLFKKTKFNQNFQIALSIVDQSMSIIVMLGGPSGTGKSSIASLLASRLGVGTVLSTDSIRHIMRNFINKEEQPILFASTYETGEFLT